MDIISISSTDTKNIPTRRIYTPPISISSATHPTSDENIPTKKIHTPPISISSATHPTSDTSATQDIPIKPTAHPAVRTIRNITYQHDEEILNHALKTSNVANLTVWDLLRDERYDLFSSMTPQTIKDRAFQLAMGLTTQKFKLENTLKLKKLRDLIKHAPPRDVVPLQIPTKTSTIISISSNTSTFRPHTDETFRTRVRERKHTPEKRRFSARLKEKALMNKNIDIISISSTDTKNITKKKKYTSGESISSATHRTSTFKTTLKHSTTRHLTSRLITTEHDEEILNHALETANVNSLNIWLQLRRKRYDLFSNIKPTVIQRRALQLARYQVTPEFKLENKIKLKKLNYLIKYSHSK